MTLAPGRHAALTVVDVATGGCEVVLRTDRHVEAPNWSRDGRWLVVNCDGELYRMPAPGAGPAVLDRIVTTGVPPINNDHVLAPDGTTIYVSGRDGHLYAVPWAGGAGRRVSNGRAEARRFKHYLHGVSADGRTLSYIGGGLDAAGRWVTNVYTVPAAGGPDRQLTDDAFPDDGAELAPDGSVWFNSERASPGHAQLFRWAGEDVEQVTDDERVNWFPHVSPDGRWVVYLSYPPGTAGHPADLDVLLRLLPADRSAPPRDLVALRGGQGTTNVNGWAPDSRRFAFVAYAP
ncbi:TolB family protein [Georgenia thermotolerans]|uniref:Biopolymer transporter Tol n=1 Tax=Georgenia thermotolerans TaxID=527326 RepID=A0A7J5UQT2_9MICO|nr:PD40 domain-containing protein [Georgenia thermotolerans]KAE8764792.1 biopolymer transporter Tol [Georgenia thermotolerans]